MCYAYVRTVQVFPVAPVRTDTRGNAERVKPTKVEMMNDDQCDRTAYPFARRQMMMRVIIGCSEMNHHSASGVKLISGS